MLFGFAMPFPAMSYAVPEDGDVLMISRPIVVLIALSNAKALIGQSP